MTDQGPSLQQRMQQQAMENAQDFYGQSLGRIKSQAQGYREQLEQYAQQLPEGNEQAQIQEMVDSYMELEGLHSLSECSQHGSLPSFTDSRATFQKSLRIHSGKAIEIVRSGRRLGLTPITQGV